MAQKPKPPAQAACAGTAADPAFFPDSNQYRGSNVAAAVKACNRCPIETSCLHGALERREQHGVWGGTTPRERRQMLRRQS